MNIKEIMLDDEKERLDTKISRVLKECNVYPGFAGYKYLKSAIEIAFITKKNLEVVKDVYEYIAIKEGVSPISVERCIRHVIHKAWELQNTCPSDVLEATFKYSKRAKYKPTNAIFIESIAEEMRTHSKLGKYL